MNIELILNEYNKVYINESTGIVRKAIDKIKKLPIQKAKNLMRSSFLSLVSYAKKNDIEDEVLSIINKLLDANYKRLKDIANKKINSYLKENNEYWDEAKKNMYGAASFYPLLQAFLELDKVVKDTGDASLGYVGVYGLIWAAVVGGKVLSNKLKKSDNIKQLQGEIE